MSFAPAWIPKIGIVSSCLYILIHGFILMQIGAWFLMFHLSYYSITHCLNMLTLFIARNNESIGMYKRIKRLKMCKRIFDQICLVSAEIKTVFSFSVLIILTLLIIVCSACLFFCIYTLVFIETGLVDALAANFVNNVVITLIILVSANSPISEVNFILSIEFVIFVL